MDAKAGRKGYSKINGMCMPDGRKTGETGELQIQVGKSYWFEYHCLESEESCDAELWHHSHRRAKVLSLEEPGYGKTMKERGEEGQPAVYKIQFEDGFKHSAFEDELLESPKHFFRPSPPKTK